LAPWPLAVLLARLLIVAIVAEQVIDGRLWLTAHGEQGQHHLSDSSRQHQQQYEQWQLGSLFNQLECPHSILRCKLSCS
jgi:hypothetical protein